MQAPKINLKDGPGYFGPIIDLPSGDKINLKRVDAIIGYTETNMGVTCTFLMTSGERITQHLSESPRHPNPVTPEMVRNGRKLYQFILEDWLEYQR